MLSQLKSFLNKFSRKTSQTATPEAAPISHPEAPTKPAAAKPAAASTQAPAAAKPRPAVPPASPAPAAAATAAADNAGPDEVLHLPLKIVLSRLTPALTALVKSPGDGNVALSTKKVLEQLPRGAVKFSFAELRQAAPAGTFLDVTSQDQTMVDLPLPEILSRLSPEHLKRKPAQRQIEVPADVGNVFGPRGEQLAQPSGDTGTMRKPAAAQPPRPSVPPQAKTAPAPKVAPAAAAPAPKVPAPRPEPALTGPAPIPQDQTQFFLKKDAVASGEALTLPLASVSEGWPQNIKEEISAQKLDDSSVALPMSRIEAALKTGKIVFAWQEIGSWLKPNPFASQLNGETALELPLKVVAPLFISQHRPVMPQKKVDVGEAIPDIFSGAQAKAGAPVAEPPAPAVAPASAPTPAPAVKPAAAPIPAPAAPAPTAPPKPAAPTTAAPAPSSIPAVGLPKPPTPVPATGLPKPPLPAPPKPAQTAPALPKLPTPPAPKAAPTPVPLPKTTATPAPAVSAAVAEKEYKSLGELFGDTAKTDWSPKDIVQATNKLKGVAGSMVSLSDGLMVAGELPAPFRAETTAAFLPQIFGRMGQYAKELHLGDMNVISFECQKAPLIIYKSGMVYFGVLGRAGETLPLAQIRFIAAELAKQNK